MPGAPGPQAPSDGSSTSVTVTGPRISLLRSLTVLVLRYQALFHPDLGLDQAVSTAENLLLTALLRII